MFSSTLQQKVSIDKPGRNCKQFKFFFSPLDFNKFYSKTTKCAFITLLTYEGFVSDDSEHNNVGEESCREKLIEGKMLAIHRYNREILLILLLLIETYIF